MKDDFGDKDKIRLWKYICKQPNMLEQIRDYMGKDDDYLGSLSTEAIKFYFYTRSIPYLLNIVTKSANRQHVIENDSVKLLALDGKCGIKFKIEGIKNDNR
jgi:hypothetical protein